MSDVPPDRRSTYALYEELREAGRRKAASGHVVAPVAPRRRRAPRLIGPAAATVAAFVLAGGGAAVGTKVFVHDEGTATVGGGVPMDVRHAPGDRRSAQATTADPGVADARWGMRVYPNADGDTCLQPGRIVNGRIGAVQGGKFRAYPDDTVGACTDLAREHASVAVWVFRVGDSPRSILYGAVDRTVTGLSVGPAGAERPVPISSDGTYIMVRLGPAGFSGQRLVVDRGGERRNVTLQPTADR